MLGDGYPPVAPDDDAVLARRVMDGDLGAFGAIYERHYVQVLRVCRSYVRNERDAQDLAHDAFAKFLALLKGELGATYREEGKLESFLTRLAARIALDHVRRPRTQRETTKGLAQDDDDLGLILALTPTDWQNEALEQLLHEERQQTVHRLLERLPTPDAAVMTLAGAGLTMRDTASALTTTVAAVKARLWRARAVAEVLIDTDPQFDAIRPEDMTRRRLGKDALPHQYRDQGDQSRAPLPALPAAHEPLPDVSHR